MLQPYSLLRKHWQPSSHTAPELLVGLFQRALVSESTEILIVIDAEIKFKGGRLDSGPVSNQIIHLLVFIFFLFSTEAHFV